MDKKDANESTKFVLCLKHDGLVYQVEIDKKQNEIITACLMHVLGNDIKVMCKPIGIDEEWIFAPNFDEDEKED